MTKTNDIVIQRRLDLLEQDGAATEHGTKILLKRILKIYLKPHLGKIIFAFLCMAVAALTTGAMPLLMENIINDVFIAKEQEMLKWVGIGVLVTFFLRGIASYGHTVTMNAIGQGVVAEIQSDLFKHLMSLDIKFFHATTAGKLISRLTNDVGIMRQAMAEGLTSVGKSILTLIVLVGIMFWQDWKLACGAFFVFPLAALMVSRIGKKLRKVSSDTQQEMGQLSSMLNQSFQGVRHVKAYGMEEFEHKRVKSLIDNVFHLIHKAFRFSAMTTPITETLSGLAIVTVIVYGGYQVIAETKTAGEFFSFMTAFLMAYEPMKKLAKLNGHIQSGLAAAERVFRLLDHEAEIKDNPDAKTLVTTDYTINFHKVNFSYDGDLPALKDFSITIPHGQTIALVGASGSGKSTALNLIPRFYDRQSGEITIGNTDIKTVTLNSLRDSIALVSQEVALFDDTVLANIAYGRIGASEEEIIKAAKDAAAHDFIVNLPDGYQTIIGENGVSLSGGQRQRLAIARAMLRNAPILLLDEATSALDTQSERAVQEALDHLSEGRTTLVIAHRLSTIIDADKIYVLDAGNVVEAGQHQELMDKNGAYANLWKMQLGH